VSNFIEFSNALSIENVSSNSLDEVFSDWETKRQVFKRPISMFLSPDEQLERNVLHTQLHPFIETVFRELNRDEQLEVLEKCYVFRKTLVVVEHDLKIFIEDAIPGFAISDGVQPTQAGPKDSGNIEVEIKNLKIDGSGALFLLLGGIGSGKTTFLYRFLNITCKDILGARTLAFRVDFLSAPGNQEDAEEFIFNSLLEQIRKPGTNQDVENRDNLLAAFQDIHNQKKILYGVDSKKAEEKFLEVIDKTQLDNKAYVPRLLRQQIKLGKTIIVVIDNVDQLSPSYQNHIFMIAQKLMREVGCIVIVALREESYYSAKSQKVLSAYNNSKFHIASPPLLYVLSKRLAYCRSLLEMQPENIRLKLRTQVTLDFEQIKDFLSIVEYSTLTRNRNIVRFIEYLSFGNMREALEMFSLFLYSGSTNVEKMLSIFKREGRYFVGFHEFARAVILGDRKYYKENESKVANLFERTAYKNNSHFTSLRLIHFLITRNTSYSSDGKGFVSIEELFQLFESIFQNTKDLSEMIIKLLRRQIVELDTKQNDNLINAKYIRVTSAGIYYYKYLVQAFAYLDLVLLDTPIEDDKVVNVIFGLSKELEKISDQRSCLEEKMNKRFERAEVFLDYLEKCENAELAMAHHRDDSTGITNQFVPRIRLQYDIEKKGILERITGKHDKEEKQFGENDTTDITDSADVEVIPGPWSDDA
jgi:hypothetical protein